MTGDGTRSRGEDRVWPVEVCWDLGDARARGLATLWQCDALRAGRLYQRSLFATREQAEAFAMKMRQMEPDQMFNVEAIKASAVWN